MQLIAGAVLPSKAVLSYLAEGGANIVYRISIPYPTPPASAIEDFSDDTPPPSEIEDPEEVILTAKELDIFQNKLLRVRKNLPTTLPCAVSQKNWEQLVVPLFHADHLVKQELVHLEPSGAIKRLNEELYGWEHFDRGFKGALRSIDYRPTKRHGVYLALDPHGLLVTDMTPGPIGEEVIEFKPKWLVQSASAPADSKRCRQCARQAQIDAEIARKNDGTEIRKSFCPLDLISKDTRNINLVAEQMEPNPAKAKRLARWLQTTTLLTQLRDAQVAMDPYGVFKSDLASDEFCLSMTLRDCTVFLRLPVNERDDANIEARLGDMDLKSPDKAQYWKNIEKQLIEEGWYQGAENANDRRPLTCQLSRC